MLKAIGKMIDTLPLEKLFSQEEHRADTVIIQIDRYYGTHDMTGFRFVMRGVTESGGESESVLTVTESDETIIRLAWEVGKEFTTESGVLALDLVAYHYPEGADPAESEPDVIIRYQLPPVKVRALPDADHPLDSHSYTEFLLQVRNVAEENITENNAIVEQFRYDFSVAQIDDRLEAVELTQAQHSQDLQTVDTLARLNQTTINTLITPELYQLRSDVETLKQQVCPTVILTQAQYDAIANPSANTLYVITD